MNRTTQDFTLTLALPQQQALFLRLDYAAGEGEQERKGCWHAIHRDMIIPL